MIDPHEWVDALADELGVTRPAPDEVEDLLSLAGTAAHTAQRWVAPVSTWLVARAGLVPADARATVEALAVVLEGPQGRSPDAAADPAVDPAADHAGDDADDRLPTDRVDAPPERSAGTDSDPAAG